MPHYANPLPDYGSYVFNGCDNWDNNPATTTLLNMSLSSVKHPTRTWLLSEWPIHWSYSWHKSATGQANISYKDAIDNVSFVDGHAAYIKLYYDATLGPAPFAYPTVKIPASYNYQNGARLKAFPTETTTNLNSDIQRGRTPARVSSLAVWI
jgi:hypothetical protein